MVKIMSQVDCLQREQFQDVMILALYSGCPMGVVIPVLNLHTIGFTPLLYFL